jgi:glycosyltransferase involved in cell wall biosynthesis
MTNIDTKLPLLSIIVPIYKVEEFLEECVESILKQEFKDYELILVDDGSPDNCGKICDNYAELDNRIKVIHKKNGGLSSARNAGKEVAKGKYLSFIDSDDFISDNYYLENMSYLINNSDVDMLVAQVCYYDNKTNKIINNIPEKITNKKNILEYLFSPKYIGSAWVNIYKSNIFSQLRFPVGRLYEDIYILPEVADKLKTIYLSNVGIYYYRNRQDSITNKKMTLVSYKQHLDAYVRILDYSATQNINKKVYIHYFLFYSHILLSALKDYNFNDFEEYISAWEKYPFHLFDVINVKSFKGKVEFLLLKIMGFKNLLYLLKK